MGRSESKAKTEAVQLVRSLACGERIWLKARWGRIRFLRAFVDCYVEMRDSALLLYKPQDSGRSDEDTLKLVETPAGKHLEMVPLRAAYIAPVEKTLTISVTKPDLSKTLDMRFPDKKSFDLWLLHLQELSGLRYSTLADFDVERHVGKGASGRVYLVHDKTTKEPLALKVIEKESVYESADSYRHALDERIVLELATNHPFILDMRYAFQNRERLFLVTEYCGGGDLFEYLNKKSRPMEEVKARYIAAEILLAIEHIHKIGAVYRDLKLENVLLDEDGHIRLADFGLSKLLTSRNKNPGLFLETGETPKIGRTKTFCGTREYVAPEMLKGSMYDTSVDLWAFGILLYEILCGRTPFYSRQRNEIYERIEKSPVFYPKDMSDEVQDLLKGLLQRNVSERLGNKEDGIAEIKAHPWFAAIDWDDLYAMRPHPNSLAQEIIQMNCGKGSSTTPSSNAKKSKRQLAQDKAMETLKTDCAADAKAMGSATPRTARSGDDKASEFASSTPRQPRVVPASNSKKKTAIIAGYSFAGRVPDTAKASEYDSTSAMYDSRARRTGSHNPEVYRNPSAGYERANVFDSAERPNEAGGLSPSTASPKSLEESIITDETVTEKTVVTSLHPMVPAFQTLRDDEHGGVGSSDLLSPASPHNLDDLIDTIVETRRESNVPPRSSFAPTPSNILRKRHEKKLFARQQKMMTP